MRRSPVRSHHSSAEFCRSCWYCGGGTRRLGAARWRPWRSRGRVGIRLRPFGHDAASSLRTHVRLNSGLTTPQVVFIGTGTRSRERTFAGRSGRGGCRSQRQGRRGRPGGWVGRQGGPARFRVLGAVRGASHRASRTLASASSCVLLAAGLGGSVSLRACHRPAAHSMTRRRPWLARSAFGDLFCHPPPAVLP
jgi:hypothetical protein